MMGMSSISVLNIQLQSILTTIDKMKTTHNDKKSYGTKFA